MKNHSGSGSGSAALSLRVGHQGLAQLARPRSAVPDSRRRPLALTGILFTVATATLVGAPSDRSVPEHPQPHTTYTNSIGIEMVAIPAGKVKMGIHPPAHGSRGSAPVHEVEIAKPYWMSTYEVSQKQWEKIMATTVNEQRFLEYGPDHFESEFDHGYSNYHQVGDDFPITWVNWAEAKGFCYRLTRRERKAGRLPANLTYDLPTEQQWEHACRAGTTSRYWWGNDSKEPSPIDKSCGQLPLRGLVANPFGLRNMHGGVKEWCRDDFKKTPGEKAGQQPSNMSKKSVRSGGGIQDDGLTQSHERWGYPPTDRMPILGFRVVIRSAPAAVPLINEPKKKTQPRPGYKKR